MPTTVTLTVSTAAPAMVMNFPKNVLPIGIVAYCLLFAVYAFFRVSWKRQEIAIFVRKPLFLLGAAAILLFSVGSSSPARRGAFNPQPTLLWSFNRNL